jgi:predicted transglutaminase-like cysteine proteinase
VILPLTVIGPAVFCAAVLLMCVTALTAISSTFKASDNHHVEPRLLNALLLLRDEPQNDSGSGRLGVARLLRPDLRFIRFDSLTLPPFAFTQFCLRYVSECNAPRPLFEGDRLQLTSQRWAELDHINRRVNASIVPERNYQGLAAERWLLSPAFGDCNDYAVTKRHQLIAMGWPAHAVLLSEVVTAWGEHHLVTVVRAEAGDLVLDNLTDRILPWFQKPYQWVRMQTPDNPNYWASVAGSDGGRERVRPPRMVASLRAGV